MSKMSSLEKLLKILKLSEVLLVLWSYEEMVFHLNLLHPEKIS